MKQTWKHNQEGQKPQKSTEIKTNNKETKAPIEAQRAERSARGSGRKRSEPLPV